MSLQNATAPELISIRQSYKTKDEAIRALIGKLGEAGKLHSEEEFYQAVIAREKLSATGLEGGLAIPHGKSEAVKEAAFAIATVEKPISDWESIAPDNQVELVVLLAIPKEQAGKGHLNLLSQLMKRLSKAEFKNQLLHSTTSEELYAKLGEEEQVKAVEVKPTNKTIVAVTACPAGIAHTYMAAEALIKAGNELGIEVFVEKQGANGIEDRHTAERLRKADAVVFAVDVAVKDEQRFSHLAKVKTPVAAPLRDAKGILQEGSKEG